jgi:hypothetical protein
MIDKLKGWIIGVLISAVILGGAFFGAASIYGTWKVHQSLQKVEETRVANLEEKSFAEVNTELDVANKAIDTNAATAKDTLKEILHDASAESDQRERKVPAAAIISSKTTPGSVSAPAKVETVAPVHRPSGTTLRTIDSVWGNYCGNFPDQPGCENYKAGQKDVSASATATPVADRTVN